MAGLLCNSDASVGVRLGMGSMTDGYPVANSCFGRDAEQQQADRDRCCTDCRCYSPSCWSPHVRLIGIDDRSTELRGAKSSLFGMGAMSGRNLRARRNNRRSRVGLHRPKIGPCTAAEDGDPGSFWPAPWLFRLRCGCRCPRSQWRPAGRLQDSKSCLLVPESS